MSKQLETNTDLVIDLMTFSPYGALSQMFIMEAIRRYAEQTVKWEPTEQQKAESFVDLDSWKGVAEDIKKRTEEFHNRNK